jgi:crotonobetainyl-CoA:carnitine CoA-transferase CaiB-like acyl-CoA transferase
MFPLFSILNRGKKSISLDLRKKEAQEIFKKLIKKSDVVIENFVKGTMEKWGLGYDILKEINPNIIYAKISGFGNDGLEEYTSKTAFDIIIQAESGILDALGIKEGPPRLPIGDYTAGHIAAIGISQALYHRERTGTGQFIDISMHDVMAAINIRAQAREFVSVSKNLDVGSKFLPVYNQYNTKEGNKIVLTTLTEKQWQRLCTNILKKPELLKDKRFENIITRFSYVEELDEIIENWSESLTREGAIRNLERERIPCGRVLTIKEVYQHPNLKARNMICNQFDFSRWNASKVSTPNRLIQFSETQGTVERIGPEFAEHNKEIYCGLLGYSENDLKNWKKMKLI